MASPESSSPVDTDRMDAQLREKCITWIRTHRAPVTDRDAGLRRQAALTALIDCVVGYVRTTGNKPFNARSVVDQTKAIITTLDPREPNNPNVLEEFYYNLAIQVLAHHDQNAKTQVDEESERVRHHVIDLSDLQ